MDDLITITVIWTHQVDGPKADRNANPLKRAELFVDRCLMSEVWNERRDGTLRNNRISVGGQGQLDERTTRPLDVKWLTIGVPITGELATHQTEESRWADGVLILILNIAAMVFDIWTVYIKCTSGKQTAETLLGAVLP